jgi:hypothetical protein
VTITGLPAGALTIVVGPDCAAADPLPMDAVTRMRR